MKGGTSNQASTTLSQSKHGSTGGTNSSTAKLQATAEQIRYAKLAQMPGLEENKIQEKIKEVENVTGKQADVASVALHESNYDTNLAIQNILDGLYDLVEDEWKTKPSKKKKVFPSSTPISAPDKINIESEIVTNHINEEPELKPPKSNKISRGGKRGGRPRKMEDKNDDRLIEDDSKYKKERGFERDKGFDKDRGLDRDRFDRGFDKGFDKVYDKGFDKGFDRFDRNRSGDRGRGRGRGRGSRGPRRGFGGGFGGRGGFSRGGPRSRGRTFRGSFGRPPRNSGRDQESNNVSSEKESNDLDKGGEQDSWNISEWTGKHTEDWSETIEAEPVEEWGKEEKGKGKEEMVKEEWGKDEWGKDEWGKDEWVAQVSEETTESLFSEAITAAAATSAATTVQADNWGQMNGPETITSWNDTSKTSHSVEDSSYLPENVDGAVIRSQRAMPAPTIESTSFQATNDISRSTYTSTFPNNQFPSSHQDSTLSSGLTGRHFTLESLAAASLVNHVNESPERSSAPMISGVHDSHKLEQEQLQGSNRTQRHHKHRRHQKPQLPSQPVEMPRLIMEELEQQLGGLEFGSGPLSPQLVQDSRVDHPVASVSTVSASTSMAFPQSTTSSVTSSVIQETTRHSVAPEISPSPLSASTTLTSSMTTSTVASKAERPKTPPGLSSLQEHSSARHFSSSPARDVNRMAQVIGNQVPVPEPIPFPPQKRSPVQSLSSSVSLDSPSQPYTSSLSNSFPGARNTLSSEIPPGTGSLATEQRTLTTEQRTLPNDQRILSNDQRILPNDQRSLVSEQRSIPNDQRTLGTDQRTLGTNQRTLGTDQRTLGTDQRTLGTDQRTLGADQRNLGTDQRNLGTDQRNLGTDQRNLGNDQRTLVVDQRNIANDERMALGEPSLKAHLQQVSSGSSLTLVTSVGASEGFGTSNLGSSITTAAAPSTHSTAKQLSDVVSTHATYNTSTVTNQGICLSPSVTTAQSTLTTKTQTSASKPPGPPGVMPLNLYGMQQGMMPAAYTHHQHLAAAQAAAYSYDDIQMVQRMPMNMASYYDIANMYQAQNAANNMENISSGFLGADNKFGRDASSPVASNMSQANQHAAAHHAQQQAAYLGAAAHIPYGYAYYHPSGMIPGTFPVFTTAPVYQMPTGKGHMGGTQYQSAAYHGQHTSHGYGSANTTILKKGGVNQEFGKATYPTSVSQSIQTHSKSGQVSGSLSSVSSGSDSGHHTGFKSQYNQDTKGFVGGTPPPLGIPLPGQNQMGSFAANPYFMQPANILHHAGGHLSHQQLDSSNQSAHIGRTQPHHSMTASQQNKRDTKPQGYGSYWPGTN